MSDINKTSLIEPSSNRPITRLIIRNLDLGVGVAVSPMVAITDLPFRRMCRRFGADLAFCEMVAGPMLARTRTRKIDLKSRRIIARDADEEPFAVQLFGSMPDALSTAAEVAAELGAGIIDFNMGCPTRRVAGNGSGSGLLREPDKAEKCIAAIRKALPDLPFTVKIRSGWDRDLVNGVEIARMAETQGADAVTVHARLRSETYAVPADWNRIREVRAAVKIPVIANGDIFTWEDVVEVVRKTGSAGVMLARGVRGNPWLIRDAKAALSGQPVPPPPGPLEKWRAFEQFWHDLVEFRGMEFAVYDIRKHVIWFTKGMHGAVDLRRDLSSFNDEAIVLARVHEFFEKAQEKECAFGNEK
jgi:tRNA-dihydrouridine synthase B